MCVLATAESRARIRPVNIYLRHTVALVAAHSKEVIMLLMIYGLLLLSLCACGGRSVLTRFCRVVLTVNGPGGVTKYPPKGSQ